MTAPRLAHVGSLRDVVHLEVAVDPGDLATYEGFNDTARDYDLNRGVSERVAKWVDSTPDAVAILDGELTWTYADLEDAATRTASTLLHFGVRTGDVVSVHAERGASYIATLLAILRVGAVYLPIDPSLPPERRAGLLAAARPAILVCGTDVPVVPDGTVVISGHDLVDAAPEEVPYPAADDAAYVVFTSGSTGTPKGAIIHHRALTNHLLAKIDDFEINADSVVAQNAPQSFDISVWQMLAPLLCGGTVAVVRDCDASEPAALLECLAARRVTLLELVPSMLRVVLDYLRAAPAGAAPLRALTAIAVGGEEVLPTLVRDWFTFCPGVPLVNVYGPTECADDVSHCRFTEAPADACTRLPIGTPIANMQLWLLSDGEDGRKRLVPIGSGDRGEICVTGIGVGRGYLDEERTDQAFFADPFGDGELYRTLYRTGDVGVVEDGQLIYLGRRDRQVKVRGQRIELPEIEATLSTHPSVRSCAVVLQPRPDRRRAVAREELNAGAEDGSRILVAHVSGPQPHEARALRGWVADRLPSAMVPHHLVMADTLPLTRNGKIDLDALPLPDGRSGLASTHYVAPESGTETAVAALWAEVLGVDTVGRYDEFLDLGGDSLRAMLVVNALNAAHGLRLRAREVLAARTVEQLAALIDAGADQSVIPDGHGRPVSLEISGVLPQIEEFDRRPLSLHQQGLWFHWLLAPENPYYNYQGAWTLTGELDVHALQRAWSEVLARHPALLTCFGEDDDGEPYAIYPAHEIPLLEVIDGRVDGDAGFRRLATARAAAPFDLTRDPLLRVDLVRVGPRRHELLFTTHEILLDGWGAAVLCEEMEAAYWGGDAADVEAVDDFTRFLAWERVNVTRERLADQARSWRAALAGPLPTLDPPLDRPRPAVPSFRGDSVSLSLAPEMVAGLVELGARSGTTLFGTLLALYAAVLGRWATQSELVIGVPAANRFDREIERTVGFLINMLPVRLFPVADKPFMELLSETADAVDEGLANCEYPFAWMLQDSAIPRGEASSPVFQTMFNMLNYPHPRNAGDVVGFAFTELETGFTKYDLSLYAQPSADGGIYLQISYHRDLFDKATISALLSDIDAACNRAVRDASTPLERLVPGAASSDTAPKPTDTPART